MKASGEGAWQEQLPPPAAISSEALPFSDCLPLGPGQCLHHGLLDVLHSAGGAVDIQKSEPFGEPSEGVPDTMELVWGSTLRRSLTSLSDPGMDVNPWAWKFSEGSKNGYHPEVKPFAALVWSAAMKGILSANGAKKETSLLAHGELSYCSNLL